MKATTKFIIRKLWEPREEVERRLREELRELRELWKKFPPKVPMEVPMEVVRELREKIERELWEEAEQELQTKRKLEQAKDSWVRCLRLDEEKRIRHISIKLVVMSGVIILLSVFMSFYFDFSDTFPVHLFVGMGAAYVSWLLVSYGDHVLREIRVQKGWYGSNAMEVYELIQFIKKTAENDSDDSSPPRRFFKDDELIAGAKVNDNVQAPDGAEVH